MKILKNSIVWTIINLIIGAVLGSGALWQYQKNKLDQERFNFEKTVKAIDIRKSMDDVYISILQLSDQYIKVSNSYYIKNNQKDADEMRRLVSRLDVLINDYTTIEKSLSEIENRDPRKIQIDFVPPQQPFNLKFK